MQKGENPWYKAANVRRKSLGLTYDQLAEVLGVSRAAVGHWLKGTRPAKIRDVKALADAMKCDPAEWLAEDAAYILSEEDERELIDLYRDSPPEIKQAIMALLGSKKSQE